MRRAVTTRVQEGVEYPTGDGKPMAETDLHRMLMCYFIEVLQARYGGQEVYVSGNLLLYYEKGNPRRHVAPDCLVAFGRPPGPRLYYQTWVEGKPPDVVIEVTSRSTRREDQVTKWRLYRRMGVRELWLVDPTGDYLPARVLGYRLADDQWEAIPAGRRSPRSELLGLEFRESEDGVRLWDPEAEAWLVTGAEQARIERQRVTEERQRVTEERQRAERYRAKLLELGIDPGESDLGLA